MQNMFIVSVLLPKFSQSFFYPIRRGFGQIIHFFLRLSLIFAGYRPSKETLTIFQTFFVNWQK